MEARRVRQVIVPKERHWMTGAWVAPVAVDGAATNNDSVAGWLSSALRDGATFSAFFPAARNTPTLRESPLTSSALLSLPLLLLLLSTAVKADVDCRRVCAADSVSSNVCVRCATPCPATISSSAHYNHHYHR